MRIAWLSQFVPYPPTSGALERSYDLLRRQLGDAGRALVEREYDWSVVGKQLDAAYAEAAGQDRPAW